MQLKARNNQKGLWHIMQVITNLSDMPCADRQMAICHRTNAWTIDTAGQWHYSPWHTFQNCHLAGQSSSDQWLCQSLSRHSRGHHHYLWRPPEWSLQTSITMDHGCHITGLRHWHNSICYVLFSILDSTNLMKTITVTLAYSYFVQYIRKRKNYNVSMLYREVNPKREANLYKYVNPKTNSNLYRAINYPKKKVNLKEDF